MERTKAERILEIDNVTRLTLKDRKIFEEAFKDTTPCYANSWLYILRASRGQEGEFGYKYIYNGTTIAIGYRNNTIYLVNSVGACDPKDIVDLCMHIKKIFSCRIILKKISEGLFLELSKNRNFTQYSSENKILLEDDVFPENSIYLDNFSHINHSLKSFYRYIKKLQKEDFKVTTVLLSDDVNIKNLLHTFLSEKASSYHEIIENISKYPDRYYHAIYMNEKEEEIFGFYAADKLSKDVVGLYVAVTSKHCKGVTEYLDFQFFRCMWEKGFKTMLLGGAETEGVNLYVKKLKPFLTLPPIYTMVFTSDE